MHEFGKLFEVSEGMAQVQNHTVSFQHQKGYH